MLHDPLTNTISIISEYIDGNNLFRKLFEYSNEGVLLPEEDI